MRAHRVYCPDLAAGLLALPTEEAHHAATVLRLHPGDAVVAFDGRGQQGVGHIAEVRGKSVSVEVERVEQRPFELPVRLTLAVALPRQHRQSYLIEKCTELGVAGIWPIVAERSTVQPRSESVDKWTRRAVEAAKQASRAWVPSIDRPQAFGEAWERRGEFDECVVFHAGAQSANWLHWLDEHTTCESVLAWIGPEGGWSPAELAITSVVPRVALSPTVLRVETAAVAACAVVASFSTHRPGDEP